jgi:hypothetical protein
MIACFSEVIVMLSRLWKQFCYAQDHSRTRCTFQSLPRSQVPIGRRTDHRRVRQHYEVTILVRRTFQPPMSSQVISQSKRKREMWQNRLSTPPEQAHLSLQV